MSFLKRTIASMGVCTIVLLAPITFQPASLLADGPSSLIRLNEACGQATSCKPMLDYLCSTFNGDHLHYTCNTGCDPVRPG